MEFIHGLFFYPQKCLAPLTQPLSPSPIQREFGEQTFQPHNPQNRLFLSFPPDFPHNFSPLSPAQLGLAGASPELSPGNNPHGNPAESPGFSALLCPYFTMSLLEPVFTAEDAGWAKNFPARQGAFSRECLVHFKKTQRGMAGKDPSTRRLRL